MALAEDVDDTVLPTLAFAQVEQLIVLHHGRTAPAEEDWSSWLVQASERRYSALLVASLGGSPNARQRAQVANTTRRDGAPRPRTALLTDSPAQRHLVTAFGWILGDRQPIKAFVPDDIAPALSWLHVALPAERVRWLLVRLRGALEAAADGNPQPASIRR